MASPQQTGDDQRKPGAAEASPGKGGPRNPGQDLQKVIARGRRRDKAFSWVGAVLIFLALGTLGVLIADLLHDGAPQLLHTHYVKEGGLAPKYNDLMGEVRRVPAKAGEPEALQFTIEKMKLDPAGLPAGMDSPPAELEAQLAKLAGQRVVVTGAVPEPGTGAALAAEKIAALPAASDEGRPGARLGRNDLVGILRKTKSGWEFEPEPLRLETASLEVPLPAGLEGERVAVSPRRVFRRQVGTLDVTEVAKLESKNFLLSMPSSSHHRAGVLTAVVGTMLVMLVTIVFALPLGVAAGIYLEEYGRKNWVTGVVEVNIANLAGVPSIIWGLLGLGLFVYGLSVPTNVDWLPSWLTAPLAWLDFDGDGQLQLTPELERSILTAGLTLGLLVLPIVIIATREAIRSVPGTIRDASFALGATKWQTVRNHVLPYSMGGILTGSIVAMSRAIGETAPLIVIGAVVYLTFLPPPPLEKRAAGTPALAPEVAALAGTRPSTQPSTQPAGAAQSPPADPSQAEAVAPPQPAPAGPETWHFRPFAWLRSPFTVLPIQMFHWTGRPEKEFHRNAAAAGIVLIVMTLSLNSLAIYLRARLRKRIKW